MYAEILFKNHIEGQQTLTYQIPENLELQIGDAVTAKLRNRINQGIILDIHNIKPDFKTLPIENKIYDRPLLSLAQIDLIKWISQYYFCPLSTVLKLFIPDRILQNKPFREKKEKEQSFSPENEKILTEEQELTINNILTSSEQKFLIQGVTGSGKTEIYAQIAKKEITKGKQVLFLVPEISLTHQMIEYFEKSLQTPATVINSKLSEGQRYKNWMDIYNNKSKFIIGSRSAIFSPFQNLSLIIIDEEHDNSYKQTNSPQYHTHKVAEKISDSTNEVKLILGSATPSIETSEKYKDTTFFLKKRIGERNLPSVEIIDLREEFHKKNKSIFSETLQNAIKETLQKKQQTILFINRRGSASSVVCRDCGYVQNCKNCTLPQTYHQSTLSTPTLICHHCGKVENPNTTCPNCTGANIRFLGIGTQRIETEIRELFPEARVLRADKDTTKNKEDFKKIYQDFKNHEADILVGTQMIAKGLDLPMVQLVGVVLADIGLNIPDFRTQENMFQLLTQVSGRAGRHISNGKVIIQTYSPENTSLKLAQQQEYEKFINYERKQRQIHKNPPFGNIATLKISGKSLPETQKQTEKVERELWKIIRAQELEKEYQINSYPSYLMKLKNKFHYIILIKNTNLNQPHEIIKQLPESLLKNKDIRINIDPLSIT